MTDREIEELAEQAQTPEEMDRVEDLILNPVFLIVETERVVGASISITPEERRRRARLSAVVALTRRSRLAAARANGSSHRGMIPGGEDEATYILGCMFCPDPDPVWVDDHYPLAELLRGLGRLFAQLDPATGGPLLSTKEFTELLGDPRKLTLFSGNLIRLHKEGIQHLGVHEGDVLIASTAEPGYILVETLEHWIGDEE